MLITGSVIDLSGVHSQSSVLNTDPRQVLKASVPRPQIPLRSRGLIFTTNPNDRSQITGCSLLATTEFSGKIQLELNEKNLFNQTSSTQATSSLFYANKRKSRKRQKCHFCAFVGCTTPLIRSVCSSSLLLHPLPHSYSD